MKITKKINNNVALAQDAKGRELIVFGKGVGFPATPYELTDLSRVQRTFYDVDEKYFDLLRDVPQEVLLAADDAPGIPPGICLCGAGHRVPGKKLSLALYQRRAAVSAHAYPPRTGRAGRRRGINKQKTDRYPHLVCGASPSKPCAHPFDWSYRGHWVYFFGISAARRARAARYIKFMLGTSFPPQGRQYRGPDRPDHDALHDLRRPALPG